MTNTRINRSLPYDGILHEVVEHAGVLYLAGVVAEDTASGMSGQAEDVLGQLERLLDANGSDIFHVLQVTIYLTDLREKPDLNHAWKKHFDERDLPARAVVGVADLGPGVKLELTAIAARR
jgi:enamine deaminase RidA (YjgF/YER057c/UK114 family)